MKKIILLMLACILMLAGCNQKTPASPVKSNNGGTQAVRIPDNAASAPDLSTSASSDTSASASKDDESGSLPAPDKSTSASSNTLDRVPKADESGSLSDSTDKSMIEIKEKMFFAQTNDIYVNPEDYLGKTIKYEGIFDSYTWEEENLTYYSVIRYGPGCCGNDGNAGFEVAWDGAYPNQNDWVEAVGILETYEEDGYEYLRLRLDSLTALPTRGAEFVSQ